MDTSNSTHVYRGVTQVRESAAAVQQVSQGEYASFGQGTQNLGPRMLIYTRGNDNKMHAFNSRDEGHAYDQSEYRKAHPDAPPAQEAHVDNGWDAFVRGLSDTLKNPLGQAISQIGKWAGARPQTQEALSKAGGNPLGFVGKELAGAAGASQATQDAVEKGGKAVESITPIWGQARLYGGMLGKTAAGQAPTARDMQIVTGDAKAIASGAAAAGRQMTHGGAASNPTSTTTSAPKSAFNPPQRLPDGRIGYPLSPTQPPRLPGATNRGVIDRRIAQSPHAATPGSYPNTVGIVNEALARGGVGLSDASRANISGNIAQVDRGTLTHAQASFRESGSFAKDAMNPRLPPRDRAVAGAGALLNATAGPAYMAERDVATHLAAGRSGARTPHGIMMDGMMTHDPLYNH